MKLKISQLSIISLSRGKYQPRQEFDFQYLRELADSIASDGIIQPIVVRAISNNKYEIIAGERRWRAAQIAKLDTVPCIIKELTDEQAAVLAIIENIQRRDLNPIEEAASFQRFHEEFGYDDSEIAKKVGKNRSSIAHARRLLTLENTVQTAIKTGQLQAGHGKVLASLSPLQQRQLALQAINLNWSVRQLEAAIKNLSNLITSSTSLPPNADLEIIERRLSEYLGSPVKLDDKSGKGSLTVTYANLDILDGIFEKIGFNHTKIDDI